MKEKGFTLIELLAVIVILAIIALIAVPIVLNIIESNRKKAFLQTGNGIIHAAEYYFMNSIDGKKPTNNTIFEFKDGEIIVPEEAKDKEVQLEFNGEIPKEGTVTIDPEGKVELVASNENYCITKGFDDKEVTIKKYDGSCTLSSDSNDKETEEGEEDGSTENGDGGTNETYEEGTLMYLATTTEEVTEVNSCAKEKIAGACKNGTAFAIRVSDTTVRNFYVINDDGKTVTLIMWYSVGSSLWGDGSYSPVGALTALKEITKDWTNLNEMTISTYESTDDGVNISQKELSTEFTGMHARLPRYSELYELYNANNNELPHYLESAYENEVNTWYDSYWTESVTSYNEAWFVGFIYGSGSHLKRTEGSEWPIESATLAIRPVIEISK